MIKRIKNLIFRINWP